MAKVQQIAECSIPSIFDPATVWQRKQHKKWMLQRPLLVPHRRWPVYLSKQIDPLPWALIICNYTIIKRSLTHKFMCTRFQHNKIKSNCKKGKQKCTSCIIVNVQSFPIFSAAFSWNSLGLLDGNMGFLVQSTYFHEIPLAIIGTHTVNDIGRSK